MADPIYDALDNSAVARIPVNNPSTLKIENTDLVEAKTFEVYIGTDRISRKTVTLELWAGGPAPKPTIIVSPPLPPLTARLFDPDDSLYDNKLVLTPIP